MVSVNCYFRFGIPNAVNLEYLLDKLFRQCNNNPSLKMSGPIVSDYAINNMSKPSEDKKTFLLNASPLMECACASKDILFVINGTPYCKKCMPVETVSVTKKKE